MALFNKRTPEAPDLPQAAEPLPPEPKPAAVRAFAERQADYASAEAEIAREHEATLAELSRRKVAASDHQRELLAELEERKAEEFRAAATACNAKVHADLAPVLSRLFDQISNNGVIELINVAAELKRMKKSLLGPESGLVHRFQIEVLEAFRQRFPGTVRKTFEPDFWRYIDGTRSFLHIADACWRATLSGNLPATRQVFEEMEKSLYSLRSSAELSPEESERWQAKVNPDPSVSARFEAAFEAKRKADEQAAQALQQQAWARHQAARRKGQEGWFPHSAARPPEDPAAAMRDVGAQLDP